MARVSERIVYMSCEIVSAKIALNEASSFSHRAFIRGRKSCLVLVSHHKHCEEFADMSANRVLAQ
jgi:hypothetical protein